MLQHWWIAKQQPPHNATCNALCILPWPANPVTNLLPLGLCAGACHIGDNFAGRSMEVELYHDSSQMTVDSCQLAAIQKGYQYFGIAVGEQ